MEAVSDGNNVGLKIGVGKDSLLHQGVRRWKKKSPVVGQDSENVAVFRISAAEVGNIF
jgi:hypothetical protein